MYLTQMVACLLFCVGCVLCSPPAKRTALLIGEQGQSDLTKHERFEAYLDFFYTAARLAGFTEYRTHNKDCKEKQVCKDGWVNFKGHCYLFEDTEKLDWEKAKIFAIFVEMYPSVKCKVLAALGWIEMSCRLHVACDEMRKRHFVDKINVKTMEKANCYASVGAKKSCESENAQLAVIETAEENTFLKDFITRLFKNRGSLRMGFWIAGLEVGGEGNWHWYPDNSEIQYSDFQPGHIASSTKENCLILWGHFNFKWADHFCDEDNYYVCEY